MPSTKLSRLLEETELNPCRKCNTPVKEVFYFYHAHSGYGCANIECPTCGFKTKTVEAIDRNGPTNIPCLVIGVAVRRWNQDYHTSEEEDKYLIKKSKKNNPR